MKSKGLGDTIEWVIETTGLSHFKPKNCNCDKRKKMLNKIVPYGNTKKENNGMGNIVKTNLLTNGTIQ